MTLAAFLTAAKDRGLKYPKARFLAPDGTSDLTLSLTGPSSKVPGSVAVKLAGSYLVKLLPDLGSIGIAKILAEHQQIATLF